MPLLKRLYNAIMDGNRWITALHQYPSIQPFNATIFNHPTMIFCHIHFSAYLQHIST